MDKLGINGFTTSNGSKGYQRVRDAGKRKYKVEKSLSEQQRCQI